MQRASENGPFSSSFQIRSISRAFSRSLARLSIPYASNTTMYNVCWTAAKRRSELPTYRGQLPACKRQIGLVGSYAIAMHDRKEIYPRVNSSLNRPFSSSGHDIPAARSRFSPIDRFSVAGLSHHSLLRQPEGRQVYRASAWAPIPA